MTAVIEDLPATATSAYESAPPPRAASRALNLYAAGYCRTPTPDLRALKPGASAEIVTRPCGFVEQNPAGPSARRDPDQKLDGYGCA